MSSFASLMLFSDIDSAALANHDDAHLTGILHLFLDLMGDIVSQDRGLGIGDLVRLNHHVDLATSLHGIGTLDAVMGVGDLLELLKTLDVVLGRLATGTGARGRDSIGGLYQDIEHRVGVDIGMVSLDSVDDNGLLTITAGKLGADDGMRALDVVVDCLAKVVQQAGALGGHNVQAKLGSHHAAQVRDFEGVLKHVLTKRSTVAQGTKGLDDLGMQVVNAGIEGSLLASLAHALLNQVGSLVIHLLDAGRVNAAVGDEVLEGDTGGLATDRVEARKNDGLWRVVDHEVDAGNLLEGPDVATLATDDTALEVIRGNVHGGNGDLGCVVGSAALNRQGQNLLGGLVALGANLLLGLANDRGSLVGDLAANLIEELLVGVLRSAIRSSSEVCFAQSSSSSRERFST